MYTLYYDFILYDPQKNQYYLFGVWKIREFKSLFWAKMYKFLFCSYEHHTARICESKHYKAIEKEAKEIFYTPIRPLSMIYEM